MFFHWLSVWITCSMAISAILHLSVHSTVPSKSTRSSTFPESLTLLSNERLVVWTNARRTTLQLSLARPAECACAWRVSVRLLSCSSASSLRDHSVQRKQILFGPLFFSAFGILGASSVMVSYSFTSIQFEPHGEQAEIVIKETKESTVFYSSSFSHTYLPFFSHSLLKNLSAVCAWKQLVSSLPDNCPGAGVLRPASQDLSLSCSLGLSSYTATFILPSKLFF